MPVKRIEPGSISLSGSRRRIYDERVRCASLSREAFKVALETDDYGHYVSTMGEAFKRLRAIELRSSFFRILKGRVERILQNLKLKIKGLSWVSACMWIVCPRSISWPDRCGRSCI